MKSEKLGAPTSAEVTNISSHGLWLYYNGSEFFAPFDKFPWFKDAPLAQIINVQTPSPGHFYWPDLDVDLSEQILTDPERFTLMSRA